MVEPHLIERGQRLVAGDMPAELRGHLLAVTTIAIAFQRMIERKRRSTAGSPGTRPPPSSRDRVDVRGVERPDRARAGVLGPLHHRRRSCSGPRRRRRAPRRRRPPPATRWSRPDRCRAPNRFRWRPARCALGRPCRSDGTRAARPPWGVTGSGRSRLITRPARRASEGPMKIGYFLSCEEWGPGDLIEQAVMARDAGFEDLWISDHYHPWNDAQGHSPFVWSVIGGLARAVPGGDRHDRRHLPHGPHPPGDHRPGGGHLGGDAGTAVSGSAWAAGRCSTSTSWATAGRGRTSAWTCWRRRWR